jgi:hypothetical protein
MSTRIAFILPIAAGAAIAALAQGPPAFRDSVDHPAIAYTTAPLNDPVSVLAHRIDSGALQLPFDRDRGYVPALLDALHVPASSQMAVFSATSLQADIITPANPRTIFFNDNVAVGWVPGGLVEVAALDPRLGPIFYTLEQRAGARPQFTRSAECLECHRSFETFGVPGLFMLTTFPPATKNGYASGGVTDERTPLARRWAGWYVTGRAGPNRHRGNKPVPTEDDTSAPLALESLAGRVDPRRLVTPYSDIAALMVFEHQTHMTNLLTYLDWTSRVEEADQRRGGASSAAAANDLRDAVDAVVDGLLFVDEASLAGPITGGSGFAEAFAAEGPRDAAGRSLRQLDLSHRLMRYPFSYMIYSLAFDALPARAREFVYRRTWEVLSGQDTQPAYRKLSIDDRRAIVGILRDTKKDLPRDFEVRAVRN